MKITDHGQSAHDKALTYGPFRYSVWCDKHQETVYFEVSASDMMFAFRPHDVIEHAASKALQQECPGCSIPPTRWPNAGEPGGAEL